MYNLAKQLNLGPEESAILAKRVNLILLKGQRDTTGYHSLEAQLNEHAGQGKFEDLSGSIMPFVVDKDEAVNYEKSYTDLPTHPAVSGLYLVKKQAYDLINYISALLTSPSDFDLDKLGLELTRPDVISEKGQVITTDGLYRLCMSRVAHLVGIIYEPGVEYSGDEPPTSWYIQDQLSLIRYSNNETEQSGNQSIIGSIFDVFMANSEHPLHWQSDAEAISHAIKHPEHFNWMATMRASGLEECFLRTRNGIIYLLDSSSSFDTTKEGDTWISEKGRLLKTISIDKKKKVRSFTIGDIVMERPIISDWQVQYDVGRYRFDNLVEDNYNYGIENGKKQTSIFDARWWMLMPGGWIEIFRELTTDDTPVFPGLLNLWIAANGGRVKEGKKRWDSYFLDKIIDERRQAVMAGTGRMGDYDVEIEVVRLPGEGEEVARFSDTDVMYGSETEGDILPSVHPRQDNVILPKQPRTRK